MLAQTFDDFELLVIDDGSTDGTVRTLARYGSRVQLLRQANQAPKSLETLLHLKRAASIWYFWIAMTFCFRKHWKRMQT